MWMLRSRSERTGSISGRTTCRWKPPGELRRIFCSDAPTHSIEQALEAEKQGADYVNLGPIFPTQTKNTPVHPLGLEIIRNAGPRLSIPFSVMGGVKESNIPQLLKAGARILAMVTELTQADDVAAKARSMRELWKMEGICK